MQQAAHAIGIDADVAPGTVKARGLTGRDAVPRPGHRGAAEIQRLPVAGAQRLHAAGIEKFRQRLDRRDGERGVEIYVQNIISEIGIR